MSRNTPLLNSRTKELQSLGNLSSISPGNRTMTVPLPTSYLNPMSGAAPRFSSVPPPLPPRRTTGAYPSSYGRMGGMSGFYSPYNRYSSYGYNSPYGSTYGSPYRMGSYGQFGNPNDATGNSFIQMAEESTRPAFESIESVVEVVSSISMMLESTYHAVHSSYSAILGVVDQFARLKDHLAQILSVLALLRGLRWLCLKVLYLLRLRQENPSVEAAWNSAELSGSPELAGGSQVSAWPFLMFVGLVIGAPWLMFKLLSKSVTTKKGFDKNQFVDESGKMYCVTTAFDFDATQRSELSFRAGEKLYVSPKNQSKGWVYACNSKKETGLIPANYLLKKRTQSTRSSGTAALQESSTPDVLEHASFPLQGTVPIDLEADSSTSQAPVHQSADALDAKVDGDSQKTD